MNERHIKGICPKCERELNIWTEENRWPLIKCACGWRGGVPDLKEMVTA